MLTLLIFLFSADLADGGLYSLLYWIFCRGNINYVFEVSIGESFKGSLVSDFLFNSLCKLPVSTFNHPSECRPVLRFMAIELDIPEAPFNEPSVRGEHLFVDGRILMSPNQESIFADSDIVTGVFDWHTEFEIGIDFREDLVFVICLAASDRECHRLRDSRDGERCQGGSKRDLLVCNRGKRERRRKQGKEI